MGKIFLIGGVGAVVIALIAVGTVVALAPGGLLTADTNARAVIHNVAGEQAGEVTFTQEGDKVRVDAQVHGLPPVGFHGFHVHQAGQCAPDFAAAGGHFNPGGEHHPAHAADMPVLLVNSDGTAEARFTTDRFTVDDLLTGDGTSVIIHADPDNYANIPSRYGEPDKDTLATGDAGARIACGVIQGH